MIGMAGAEKRLKICNSHCAKRKNESNLYSDSAHKRHFENATQGIFPVLQSIHGINQGNHALFGSCRTTIQERSLT